MGLGLKCSCCGGVEEISIRNCRLAPYMSETYCDSCTEKGIEVWWVVLSIIDMCIHGQFKVEWRISVAPWAVEIIDRSMAFYGKTEEQMLKDSRGDERDTTANG